MEVAFSKYNKSALARLLLSLILSGFAACLLWFVRVFKEGNIDYWYLLPNYFLGILPLLFAWLLKQNLAKEAPRQWFYRLKDWSLFGLWLLFVPNSFYLVTDFIHLGENSMTSVYDVVLIGSFAINGFIIGYLTVLYMHKLLAKRFDSFKAGWLVVLILLACSVALYLGRDPELRLNSWDIVVSPLRILLGIGDVLRPSMWLKDIGNTLMYFALLGPIYLVVLALVDVAKSSNSGNSSLVQLRTETENRTARRTKDAVKLTETQVNASDEQRRNPSEK